MRSLEDNQRFDPIAPTPIPRTLLAYCSLTDSGSIWIPCHNGREALRHMLSSKSPISQCVRGHVLPDVSVGVAMMGCWGVGGYLPHAFLEEGNIFLAARLSNRGVYPSPQSECLLLDWRLSGVLASLDPGHQLPGVAEVACPPKRWGGRRKDAVIIIQRRSLVPN